MTKSFAGRKGMALTWGLAVVLLTLPALAAQTTAGKDPAKMYEKFLGKYEFDLSAMGDGLRVFEFYVKDGAFWIEYGFTSPGELRAVENSSDQFAFTDPDDGLIKITFQKDDEGRYSKCRVEVESMNLDVVGFKQK